MNQYFFVATAEVENGPRYVFIVMPNGDLKEDSRSPAEIIESASSKGYEVSYCALYTYNVGKYTSEQIRAKIVNWVKYRNPGIRSDWDVEVDVVNRVLDPGPAIRKRQRAQVLTPVVGEKNYDLCQKPPHERPSRSTSHATIQAHTYRGLRTDFTPAYQT